MAVKTPDTTCSGITAGLLTRKRAVYVASEETAGTPINDAAKLNVVLARDITVTPLEAETVERTTIRDFFGNYPELLSTRRASVTIECEFNGGGLQDNVSGDGDTLKPADPFAPQWEPLLKACGFAAPEVTASTAGVTGTPGTHGTILYKPVSDLSKMCTVTILCRVDGIVHNMRGCLGTFSIAMTQGEIPTITFTMTGHYNAPYDWEDTLVSPGNRAVTLSPPPMLFNTRSAYYDTSEDSLFGKIAVGNAEAQLFTTKIIGFSLDVANEVIYREFIDSLAADPKTGQNIFITDRKAAGTMTVEATKATESYPWAEFGTGIGRSLKIGVNGNVQAPIPGSGIEINSPSVTTGAPSYGDDQGIVTLEVPLRFQPIMGNDDFTITAG